MGKSLSCLSKTRCLSTFKAISPLIRPQCNQTFRNTQGSLVSPHKLKFIEQHVLMQHCGYLLERLFVPVDHQGPRLHQDVQCAFLHPVKQLLKRGHQSVIHLPSQLLIHTKAPPGRAEKICGVKELRRREERRQEARKEGVIKLY